MKKKAKRKNGIHFSYENIMSLMIKVKKESSNLDIRCFLFLYRFVPLIPKAKDI